MLRMLPRMGMTSRTIRIQQYQPSFLGCKVTISPTRNQLLFPAEGLIFSSPTCALHWKAHKIAKTAQIFKIPKQSKTWNSEDSFDTKHTSVGLLIAENYRSSLSAFLSGTYCTIVLLLQCVLQCQLATTKLVNNNVRSWWRLLKSFCRHWCNSNEKCLCAVSLLQWTKKGVHTNDGIDYSWTVLIALTYLCAVLDSTTHWTELCSAAGLMSGALPNK